jgi:hypothetical protein
MHVTKQYVLVNELVNFETEKMFHMEVNLRYTISIHIGMGENWVPQ